MPMRSRQKSDEPRHAAHESMPLWPPLEPPRLSFDRPTARSKSSCSTTITAQWEDLQSEAIDVSVEASGQPNLTIAQFEGEAAGDTLTLSITIENNGTLGASGFWVDVFVDPSTTPSPGDYGDAYAWVDYLGQMQSLSAECT